MSRRTEVMLTVIGIIIACVTLLFGDNIYQQLTGRSVFQPSPQEANPPIIATQAKATSPSPKQTKVTIVVPSTVEWQNTTIQLNIGDKVSISASGEWSHGYQGDTGITPYYDAGGFDKYDGTVYLPTSKVGALIGKIGNGSLFFVGSEFEFVSTESGTLYLGINDTPGSYARENNAGELTVTITVIESP